MTLPLCRDHTRLSFRGLTVRCKCVVSLVPYYSAPCCLCSDQAAFCALCTAVPRCLVLQCVGSHPYIMDPEFVEFVDFFIAKRPYITPYRPERLFSGTQYLPAFSYCLLYTVE